jgi:hypothetical protein
MAGTCASGELFRGVEHMVAHQHFPVRAPVLTCGLSKYHQSTFDQIFAVGDESSMNSSHGDQLHYYHVGQHVLGKQIGLAPSVDSFFSSVGHKPRLHPLVTALLYPWVVIRVSQFSESQPKEVGHFSSSLGPQ